MATVEREPVGGFGDLISALSDSIVGFGDLAVFSGRAFSWTFWRRPATRTLIPIFYAIGVRSVPVVAVTGLFIGMADTLLEGDEKFNLIAEHQRKET